MNEAPMISILMPAYNAALFIQEAVDSILKQDYLNWELLILDDASEDTTPKIIKGSADHRIRIYRHGSNKGYLNSCNELFNLAKGELITFLDADDTCPKDRLSSCSEVFQVNTEIHFLTTDHVRTDKAGKTISEHSVKVDYQRYSSDSDYYPTVCCATIMLRKNLLRKVGGYHPFFNGIGGEDYHWLFRLSLEGKGIHLNRKLYNYRTHTGQLHDINPNPLKFFASDIDRQIRTELLTNGSDLLRESEKLRERWLTYTEQHPEELEFKMARWMLNSNRHGESFSHASRLLRERPFSITSWYRFLYICYSIALR